MWDSLNSDQLKKKKKNNDQDCEASEADKRRVDRQLVFVFTGLWEVFTHVASYRTTNYSYTESQVSLS